MFNRVELLNTLQNNYVDIYDVRVIKKNIDIYNAIIYHTNYLDINCKFAERIYHLINDLYEIPKCKECNNVVKFVSRNVGYKQYCSNVCNLKSIDHKEKSKKTCIDKYGVDYALKSDEVRKKIKKTCIDKYGVECAASSPELRARYRKHTLEEITKISEKRKKTMNERYGCDAPLQNKDIHECYVNTLKDNYGVVNVFQCSDVKNKSKNTVLRKYNVSHIMKNPDVRLKIEKTMLKRYGVKHALQNHDILKKQRSTLFKNYGVYHPMHDSDIRNKISDIEHSNFIPKMNEYLKLNDLEFVDSEYKGRFHYHNFKCLKCGNVFNQRWVTLYQGYKCPICYPRHIGVSYAEIELVEFILSLNDNIICNDRKILDKKELDIFIPSKNIAIEYDGLYWHSNEYLTDKYHLHKTEECLKNGIQLIHIFEDEWIHKKEIVKSRLENIIGINNKERIHARKCIIKEISSKTKNEFLDMFHLQGRDTANIKLGAFYNNELVAVMTFSKGNISKGSSNKKDIWELNRFCINYNYRIPGIASKLLEYFKRNYEWKEIFSYADRRWSQGNLYEKLGFEFVKNSRPNYWYIKAQRRIHRFNLRKRPDEPKDKTEFKLRKDEGYIWIYDCGSIKYVLRNEES